VVALNFLLIAGCAYFAARAVNDTVARRLIVIPPSPNAAIAQRGPIQRPRDVYDVIVDRDIFNAVKQEATAAPPPPPAATDLHLKLVGVSLASWTNRSRFSKTRTLMTRRCINSATRYPMPAS